MTVDEALQWCARNYATITFTDPKSGWRLTVDVALDGGQYTFSGQTLPVVVEAIQHFAARDALARKTGVVPVIDGTPAIPCGE